MRLRYYDDMTLDEVPDAIIEAFDSFNDVFEAAFLNYPNELSMQLVVAWGTTGDEKGEPGAVLVITDNHIVTGYVDMVPSEADQRDIEAWIAAEEADNDDEERERYLGHEEPTVEERLAKMIAFYRRKTKAPYLVVHDADDTAEWLKQGFVHATPPEAIAADDALEVLIWGTLPMALEAFLEEHGLSWSREQHRVGATYQEDAAYRVGTTYQEDGPSFYLQVPTA
jgi:hypothetical protein